MAIGKTQYPTSGKIVAMDEHIAPGRVLIKRYTPRQRETKSAGGILMPDTVAAGQAARNAKGEIVTVDRSAVYGVVTGCGLAVERGTYKPFDRSIQEELNFPLPKGTLVVLSQANDSRVGDDDSYNTNDLHKWVLPGEPRPWWAPEEQL